MGPFYIRAKGTNKIQGIFWARTIKELFWAVDEMCDPFECQYSRIRHAGGLWHTLSFEEAEETRDGTPEAGYEDAHTMHPIGDGVAGATTDEIHGYKHLNWSTFPRFRE